MLQVSALTGHRIVLLALGAICLVWALLGFDLWAFYGSGNNGASGEGRVSFPPLSLFGTAIFFPLLVVIGARLLWQVGEQLRLQNRIVDQTSEAMLLTDAGLRIVAVNPAFEQITGFLASDVIGQTPYELGSGRYGADFYRAVWGRAAENGYWRGELWGRRKGGEIYPKQMRIQSIQGDGDQTTTHFVAVFSDISDRKAQEARIDYLSHHDPLTSLPNRLAMDHYLNEIVGSATGSTGRLAVLIIDLDDFKTVNDSLGHHAGDRLLGEMATRLHSPPGEGGHLFRLGGDEFVVIIEDVRQLDTVVARVQRLMQSVAEPCELDGHALHISASIGISLYPDDGEDAETLIRNADTAMYHAKANGRNNYQFFAPPMNAAANKRLLLESELWQALADNQLVLHYQPQVDLASGRVVGVEALVRWAHPLRGMIPPAEFIPLAEECGLILPLGHWVLSHACRQAKDWLDQGVDIGEMAVNISAHEFRQPEFTRSVRTVLLETGLPPERLELEITESTVMHSADAAAETLAELKRMGIKLAIDDFGTGYSSLSYLRRFAVDRLKIDRTFVADVESDVDAAALVTSIIALGRSLGLHLVAEGVENSAQADFLRDLACQRVQGFHFFRPLSAEEVPAIKRDALLVEPLPC